MRTLLSVGAAAALTIGLGTAAAPLAHAAPSDYTIELLPPIAGGPLHQGVRDQRGRRCGGHGLPQRQAS